MVPQLTSIQSISVTQDEQEVQSLRIFHRIMSAMAILWVILGLTWYFMDRNNDYEVSPFAELQESK